MSADDHAADLDHDFQRLTALVAQRLQHDGRPELGEIAHLQPAVRALLGQAIPHAVAGPGRVTIRGWGRRPPGHVDVALRTRRDGLVCVECKVDKIGETLWDLVKLCSIAGARRSYLLVAAWDRYWHTKPLASLYVPGIGPRDHAISELIARWPDAWADVLEGGRGIRPREVPAIARIEGLASHQISAYPRWELRCLSVTTVGEERLRFDEDGWPR